MNPLQLVLLGTVMEVSAFLFEVPTGVVADVYSRRLSIIIGVALVGLSFALQGAVAVFVVIAAAQVLFSAGFAFTSGATEAWIADEIGEERAGRAFMRGAQAGQLGTLIGTIAAVGLALISLALPLIVGGLLLLALAALLSVVMPERGFTPLPRGQRSSWGAMAHTLSEGLRVVRARPVLITILLAGVFLGLWSEGFDRLWEAHFLASFPFPSLGGRDPVIWFGVIRIGVMLLSIAATEVARRRVDTNSHLGAIRALFLLDALLAVSLVAFGLAQGFAMALAAFWSASTLRRVNHPIYLAWTNQHVEPSVRATVMSATSQADALGQLAGGPLLGAIATGVSIGAAMVVSALMLAPVLPLYVYAARMRVTGSAVRGSDAGS